MSTEAEEIEQDEHHLTEEDPRFEQAVLGREIEIWIEQDPIGQYVIKRAQEDIEAVKEALLTEMDLTKIRALQAKAAVCNHIRQWLGEAVQAGRAAVATLQQERDTQHED